MSAVALVSLVANANAGGPPPLELMDHSQVRAPLPHEEPVGPPIGIKVTPYSKGNVKGLLVTKDTSRRTLWYLDNGKNRRTARFRVNGDVIIEVNDNEVRSETDVLRCTFDDWNSLKIKDLKTGQTGEYWVELGQNR